MIGSGPGGYGAAIRSAQLGGRVLLIEKEELGGLCTNAGCLPTKALVETARFLSMTKNSDDFGVTCKGVDVNFQRIMEVTDNIVKRSRRGLQYLMKANRVEVVRGIGRVLSSERVEISLPDGQNTIVQCKNTILATGSVPSDMSIPGLYANKLLTPEGIPSLEETPSGLLITGGSLWGTELAFIFEALGAQVTYAQPFNSLLPGVDEMLSAQMKRILRKRGIETLPDAEIIEAKGGKILVKTGSDVKEVSAEFVLNTARKPLTEGLGLDKIGVKLNGARISVDDHMETNVSGIYAVGDVTGGDLAYVALEEGLVAAENAMGENQKINREVIPKVLFAIPQLATVGLTEKEAKKKGYTVKVGQFPFIASGRAVTLREKEGFVKVVVDAVFGEILGVHILGPGAIPMIAEASLAIKMEAAVEDVTSTIHAHPTISEALREAFLDIDGKAIHKA